MALCPGARPGDANIVAEVFADMKLSGVSENAENFRWRPVSATRRHGRQTPAGCLASRGEVQLKHDDQNSDDMKTGRTNVGGLRQGYDSWASNSGGD